MRGYLLDTSITSVFAPGRSAVPPQLADWMHQRDARLYLSTVTIFEARQGIARLARQGGRDRAGRLADWLDGLVASFGARVLDVDRKVAGDAGALADHAIAIGRHPGLADVLIAATALSHDLVLLTRNLRHFAPLGIAAADPLISLPD